MALFFYLVLQGVDLFMIRESLAFGPFSRTLHRLISYDSLYMNKVHNYYICSLPH